MNRAGRTGNMPGGALITGQIISKDEISITIQTPDNSSKIIYFSEATTIQKTMPTTITDLAEGDTIRVNGKENSTGIITADNIFLGDMMMRNRIGQDEQPMIDENGSYNRNDNLENDDGNDVDLY